MIQVPTHPAWAGLTWPAAVETVTKRAIEEIGGGVVRVVRDPEGEAVFMAGNMALAGFAVAALINSKWLIPDGPRDYRKAIQIKDNVLWIKKPIG